MADQAFQISYSSIPNVSFPNARSMEKYLRSEASVWRPFLEELTANKLLETIRFRHNTISAQLLQTSFDRLIEKLDNPRDFNRATFDWHHNIVLPPPSSSIEGQLILGLFENDRKSASLSAYIWFVNQTLQIQENANQPIGAMVATGRQLSNGAYAAEALPFRQTSSKRLAGAARSAEANAEALGKEVENAQKINKDHEEALLAFRSSLKERAHRIENVISRRERHSRKLHASWMQSIETQVENKFKAAETRLQALDRANRQVHKQREDEFKRLLDLFHTQLRLRAPVKLWEERAAYHSKKSHNALKGFGTLTALTIFAGALIPFCFGDYIAASFFTQVCNGGEPLVCEREFSAKGPLTVAGILVIMSLLTWTIRLQYRIYLSERHLSLDASEKKAFAETFLAMREGEDVGAGNEAIVLASLFRPTQDGIIKDDENAVDLSAAAILAKQLGRNGN